MFFVYLMIFGLVSSTSAYREKRQTENLEYVLNLLKQRGLLGQVDPELLTKAQNVIQSSKQDEFENDEDYDEEEEKETLRRGLIDRRELFSNSRERTFRSGLIDRRSQFRSKDDIQDNRRSIYESRNDLFRNSLRMDSVECDALKSENDLLKKRLETAERRGTNSIEDNSQLSALKVLQQQIQGSESQISHVLTPSPENSLGSENPLNLLKVEGGLKVRNSGEDYEKLQLSSSLVPLEPTISTFFETTSFESTILETKTTELPIHFHGRVIVRSIYDTESRVETVTSIITKSTEITPTPTWTTFTITPTQSIVPTPPAQKTQISRKLIFKQRRHCLSS
ncbi:uncharacterized protein LOC111697717 [Eurytemora carolleeae]|uniref:uncharacterized protein LOC111697717 n=1 Tax=Eurytemora carolleeae TaxID=1294199 RepID=UPI000C77E8F9|nr:uncharacterized protein LOC111697717 [Eurytemora carolleeae]|eukprot:XP_023323580.1 uncharacterized protein LOC111697717 [Eurytemora affinis]